MSLGGQRSSYQVLRRWLARCAATGAVLLVAAGCGHSAPARHVAAKPGSSAQRTCTSSARDGMARALALEPRTVATAASIGNDAMPQCSFTARLPGGERVEVTANLDTAPSPYFVLERTIVEASQVFGPRRLSPAPVSVTGLGLEAAWFPAEQQLMATDGTRLITSSVVWGGASQRRKIALGRAVTRGYLRTPRGKAAQALAEGYPSG